VIVLDAYALVGYLVAEPVAAEVEQLMRDGSLINVVNVAEVVDQVSRGRGVDPTSVRTAIELLGTSGLEIELVDDDFGFAAGELRATHYHRRSCPISLTDCMAIVSGQQNELAVATSDGPLASVARQIGVAVHPLPDSQGRRP
jgi:PIN domain nuclease of toxin-antitoxin system